MSSIKRLVFVLTLLFLSSPVRAQEEETLLGSGFESGGYGGPVVKFTNFKGEFAVMVGGYGGWLINHQFMLGGGGYGLATQHSLPLTSNASGIFPDNGRIEFGYGGGILEYIFAHKSVVHSSVSLLIGGGAVTMSEHWSNPDSWMHGYQADAVFVLEPSLNVEVNVTSFFRVNAGGSYRYVNGASMYGLTMKDLSGASLNLALKFGGF